MKPVLLEFTLPLLGKITFPAYFTMLAIAFIVGLILLERAARSLRISPLRLYDMGIFIVVISLFGARFLHVIADGQLTDYVNLCVAPQKVEVPVGKGGPKTYVCSSSSECGDGFLCDGESKKCYPERDCLTVFKVWRGGLVFYGGFIFASLFTVWYLRRFKLPSWKVLDVFGYIMPLGLFIARLGCLLNGCCYGKITSVPWAIRYGRWRGPWEDHLKAGQIDITSEFSKHVHPTQLYHSAASLLIFLIAYFIIRKRKTWDGQVLAFFLVGYSIQRFIIEFFRNDPRGSALHLSTSQLISLAVIAVGLWIYWKKPSIHNGLKNASETIPSDN
ncbi:MAG: prolipoprotein diacylglyceryl transferase [Deltaproteobacteria bacterium]|nr:prolipoprotein diacylglyceryl transferase [Deltaproteobacteria bacterium]